MITQITPKKVYLAGPLGFSEVGRAFTYNALIPGLLALGHYVIDPFRLHDQEKIDKIIAMPYGCEKRDAWVAMNKEIGSYNAKAIYNCDMMLAILDGVDVDSGTASEIGYAAALNKLIVGYRGDFRLSSDNEGSTINLQVEYFINSNGGKIYTTLDSLLKSRELCPLG